MKSSMAERPSATGWRAVARTGRSIRLRNCWTTTWKTSDLGPKRATFSPTLDSDNRAGARWSSDSRRCREASGTKGGLMKMRIQLIMEDEAGGTTTAEIADIERRQSDDLIGLSLEEAKAMTRGVQRAMVEAQARAAMDRGSTCPECQAYLRRNGSHRVRYRTPFGRLDLDSPRFYRCRCQVNGTRSFSPVALWLGDHTSPQLQYLHAQFAALLSYGASARILRSVLPLEQATSITTWKRHVARVGGRLDEEAHHRLTRQPALNEFGLPARNPLRAVGIDGGDVKASDAPSRQERRVEVMGGKRPPREGGGQVFAVIP